MEYFQNIFENELNKKSINDKETFQDIYKYETFFLSNNNDVFNFLDSLLTFFNLFIFALYDLFLSFTKNIKEFFYQIEIIFLTVIFTFGFVYSFDNESNSNISTNLIISAYFSKKNYTRITCGKIIEVKRNDISFEKENNEKMNIFLSLDKILISIICFLFAFLIIKLTINSRFKNFVIFNSLGFYISFNLVQYLYKNKYYFSSSFMFILLIYFDKNLLDSIFIKLRFQRKDFEIFSRNLISFSIAEFILKFLSLLNITFFSCFLSITRYNFFLNYFINYLCILALLSFIGNCFEQFAPLYLKPFKNIIIFIVGVLNIFSSKMFKKIIFKENTISYFYSLYLINDIFSAYCINFINGYIEYQIKYYLNVNSMNNTFIANNYFILGKYTTWFSFIIISLSISYLGIFSQEYFLFLISLYITKRFILYFSQLYNINFSRILNNIIILNFLNYIPILESLKDIYFLSFLKNLTNLDNKIIIFSLEFIFLLLLIYYIIATNFVLYIGRDDIQTKSITNKISKFFNIILLLMEIIIHFLIMRLLINLYKYKEQKMIINGLILFCVIIYHLLKIPSIIELKKNNGENINYNFYIFIWVIISLVLIELSGPEISLIYLVNHVNLIFFINFFILNDKNNNIFKIIVIFFLLIDYYRLHSCLFIIDAIAIIIYPIIKDLRSQKNEKNYNKNERYRINLESIKAYNRLTFSFALFLLFFSLIEIG